MKRFHVFIFSLIGTLVMFHASVFAGNGPFFVTYDHHPAEKGEFEIMLMNDFAVKSRVGKDYVAQMMEVEYGVTDRWTTEPMWEWQKTYGDSMLFTGWRWENRVRLFKRELPVNPMLYAEWENLNGATKFKMEVSGFRDKEAERNKVARKEQERILETRLVLGKDFGPLTVAFNWINETDTQRKNAETAFGYSFGVKYTFNSSHSEKSMEEHHEEHKGTQWVVGAEMYGALGDTHTFGIYGDDQEHYFAPVIQVMTHISGQMFHFHVSPAIGLTEGSDNLYLRTAIGVEF